MKTCCYFLFDIIIVSQSVATDEVIDSTVTKNSTQHVDYPLPDNGITIKVNSTSGNCHVTVFGSTFIITPNEALNDIEIDTSSWEDAYLNLSLIFNKDTASRLYLAIRGADDIPCTIQISAEEGDVSTGQSVTLQIFHSCCWHVGSNEIYFEQISKT